LTQAETDLKGTTDHTNYLTEFEKRAEQIKKDVSNAGSKAGLGPTHGLKLQSSLTDLLQTKKRQAIEHQARLKIDHSRSQGMSGLSTFANQASSAETPELRNFYETKGGELIQDLLGAGAINNVEAFQWGSQFQKEIVSKRVEFFSTGLKTEVEDLSNKALRDTVNTAHYAQTGPIAHHSGGRRLAATGEVSRG
jgi:hypothetical protein